MGKRLPGSNRSADHHSEKMLAAFLNKYFWKELEKQKGIKCEYQNSIEMQKKGVDVILKDGDKTLYVDEKSTMSYSNAMIPTFAFEINSIQRVGGEPLLGWFLNDDLLTTHYLLVWANFKCKYDEEVEGLVRKEKAELTVDDIVSCEVFLVESHKVRELVESWGWDKDRLLAKSKEVRSGMYSGKLDRVQNKYHFFYTDKLAEKPFNIVIQKAQLKKIASEKYLVSKLGMGPIED